MIPTLQTFVRALLTPDLSLKSLSEARVQTDASGLPQLRRTTRFAEAQITWQGQQWLLSVPLTAAALPHIERVASALRRINSEWLAQYRILPGELRWTDNTGTEQACDLVLQHLPAGSTLDEALQTQHRETLLLALDALEAELRRLDIAHNNLKAENLCWSGGRLMPLRYHDLRIGESAANDAAAFEALRHQIDSASGGQEVHDVEAAYNPLRRLTGHLWTSNVFEGLVLVEDQSGYGYVDTSNNPVIAAQFKWAGDFHEGRAEVETATGMGLIDRTGKLIIPAEFEIVDYQPAQSIVRVRQNGRWAVYDYLGRRLTEFGEECRA